MTEVPAFATVAEADAWMAARLDTAAEQVRLSRLMLEFARTFTWWKAEDGNKVGYSVKRMKDGTFGWCVLNPNDAKVGYLGCGMYAYGTERLRRNAKLKAMKEYTARSPKWAARQLPKGTNA